MNREVTLIQWQQQQRQRQRQRTAREKGSCSPIVRFSWKSLPWRRWRRRQRQRDPPRGRHSPTTWRTSKFLRTPHLLSRTNCVQKTRGRHREGRKSRRPRPVTILLLTSLARCVFSMLLVLYQLILLQDFGEPVIRYLDVEDVRVSCFPHLHYLVIRWLIYFLSWRKNMWSIYHIPLWIRRLWDMPLRQQKERSVAIFPFI